MPEPPEFDGDYDAYEVLNITIGADEEDIWEAVDKWTPVYHPSVNTKNPDWAKKWLAAIERSAKILTDTDERKMFDEKYAERAKSRFTAPAKHLLDRYANAAIPDLRYDKEALKNMLDNMRLGLKERKEAQERLTGHINLETFVRDVSDLKCFRDVRDGILAEPDKNEKIFGKKWSTFKREMRRLDDWVSAIGYQFLLCRPGLEKLMNSGEDVRAKLEEYIRHRGRSPSQLDAVKKQCESLALACIDGDLDSVQHWTVEITRVRNALLGQDLWSDTRSSSSSGSEPQIDLPGSDMSAPSNARKRTRNDC